MSTLCCPKAVGLCEDPNCSIPRNTMPLIINAWGIITDAASDLERIRKYIDRSDEIEFYISTNGKNHSLEYYLPISFFHNKNVSFRNINTKYPNPSIILYTENNMKQINASILFFNINAVLKYTGDLIDNICLNFRKIEYNTHELGNSIILNKKNNYFFNISHNLVAKSMNDNKITIEVTADSINSVIIFRDHIQIIKNGVPSTIDYLMDVEIMIKGPENFGHNSITISIENIYSMDRLPLIKINHIYNISFLGEWPDAQTSYVRNEISLDYDIINKVQGMVHIESDYFPFHIIGEKVLIHVNSERGTTICGYVNSTDSTHIYSCKGGKRILITLLQHYNGFVYADSVNLDINILFHQYNFSEQANTFPIVIAVGSEQSAFVRIAESKWDKINETIKTLQLNNKMDHIPNDDELLYLLDGQTTILEIPFISYYYFIELNISYTKDSNIVHGFESKTNVLKISYLMDFTKQFITLRTKGISPKLLPIRFCLGEEERCLPNMIYINDSSDLSTIPEIREEYHQYEFFGFSQYPIEIGLQNIIIENLSISCFIESTVHFDFPKNPHIISSFLIGGGTIVGKNEFVCDHLSLLSLNRIDPAFDPIYNCNILETDLMSFEYVLKADKVQELIIFPNIDYIDIITENQFIYVNNYSFSTDFYENLTIVGLDFIIKNNGNITKGYTIISSSDWTVIQFMGDWVDLEIENKIVINPLNFMCIIYLCQPHFNPKVEIIDNNQIQFVISYNDFERVCIYKNTTDDCIEYGNIKRFKYDNVNKASELDSTHLELIFSGWGTLDDSNNPQINLTCFNKKNVYFTSASVDRILYAIISLPKNIDLQLTSFTFMFVKLKMMTTPGEITEARFGYLSFIMSHQVEMNNIHLHCDHLYCRSVNLAGWYNITIEKELTVTDFFSNQPYNVYFTEFVRGDRLNIQVFESVNDKNVAFVDNNLIAHKGVFHIPKSNFTDVNLYLTYEEKPFSLICKSGNSYIPICNVQSTSHRNISFIGEWPESEHQFYLSFTGGINLFISNTVNININGIGVIHMHIDDTYCEINGTVSITKEAGYDGPVLYLHTQTPDNRTLLVIDTLIMQDFQDGSVPAVVFSDSNIHFKVFNILSEISNYQEISFQFLIDEKGLSTLFIVNPLGKFRIARRIKVMLGFSGPLMDAHNYNIHLHEMELLIAPAVDLFYDFALDLEISVSNPTHGFIKTINMKPNDYEEEGYTALYLYCSKDPALIPYIIQFSLNENFKTDVNKKIKDFQHIISAFDDISTSFKFIEFYISNSLLPSYPISLSYFTSKYNINLAIISEDSVLDVFVDEPGPGLVELMFRKTRIRGEDRLTINNIQRLLLLEGSSVDEKAFSKEIGISEILSDPQSLSELLDYYEFVGDINATIYGVINVIFTTNGWQITTNDTKDLLVIVKGQFRFISFVYFDDLRLIIDEPFIQTSIVPAEFYGLASDGNLETTLNVIFDRGWDRIINCDCVSFYSVNCIDVKSFSAPIPGQINHSCYDIKFNIDEVRVGEKFNISESLIIDKEIILDVSHFPMQYWGIASTSLTVKGNSSISFINSIGNIETENITIMKDSTFSISSVSVSKNITLLPNSTLDVNRISFGNESILNIHWIDNIFPKVNIGLHIYDISVINLILDDNNPNYDNYNMYLYQHRFPILTGNFECGKWEFKVNFKSSDMYFSSGDQNILTVQCNVNKMEIFGYKAINIPDETNIPTGGTINISYLEIIIIVLAGVIVISIIIIVVVLCKKNKKKGKMNPKLNSSPSLRISQALPSKKDTKKKCISYYSSDFSESSNSLDISNISSDSDL